MESSVSVRVEPGPVRVEASGTSAYTRDFLRQTSPSGFSGQQRCHGTLQLFGDNSQVMHVRLIRRPNNDFVSHAASVRSLSRTNLTNSDHTQSGNVYAGEAPRCRLGNFADANANNGITTSVYIIHAICIVDSGLCIKYGVPCTHTLSREPLRFGLLALGFM